MNKIIFTGDYKELEKLGFQFHKLYAKDYPCYEKDDVWIWENESEVVIGDCYSKSAIYLSYFIQHQFSLPNKFNQVVFNTKTSQIEEYDFKKHDPTFLFIQKGNVSDEEVKSMYETYKKKGFDDETLATLQQLYENNWISIVPDEEACTN